MWRVVGKAWVVPGVAWFMLDFGASFTERPVHYGDQRQAPKSGHRNAACHIVAASRCDPDMPVWAKDCLGSVCVLRDSTCVASPIDVRLQLRSDGQPAIDCAVAGQKITGIQRINAIEVFPRIVKRSVVAAVQVQDEAVLSKTSNNKIAFF